MQANLLERIGRYEIVGELGAGSMSRVYLAHDPNLDRKVAIKVVLRGFSLDAREQTELERRFLLEARAAGKLSHPGIVRVYDAATDPETRVPYIAMEWVLGRSLRDLIEDRARLAASEVLGILAQVARALDYAHRSGRIHRDIKPSNILISTEGVAKVSDFGVAKIMSESHTISGQVLGTPAYMSPEQIKDEPLDGRSDLFSLGAVLYQCVSGTTPFGGDTLVQIVYKILNVDPRPLQTPGSPPWRRLAEVVDRALNKDPEARFQTGAEFAEALDEARRHLDGQYFAEPPRAADGQRCPTPPDTVAIRPLAIGPDHSTGDTGPTETIRLDAAQIQASTANRPPGTNVELGSLDTVATSAFDPPVRPGRRVPRLGLTVLLLLAAALLGVYSISWLTTRQEPSPDLGPVAVRPVPRFDLPPAEALSDDSEPPPRPLRFPAEPPSDPALSAEDPAQPRGTTPGPSESPESTSSTRPRRVAETRKQVRSRVESGATGPERTGISDPQAVAPETASSSVEPLTPVTILYRHRGGLAYLSVRIDGMRVWSQELQPVVGRLRKLSGHEARAVVPVPIGVHTLEVQLTDAERDIDATGAIRSRYTNGRRRTLRADLDPDINEMQLRWKE